ncbi:MAG: hypothetical protein JSS51_04240 [Planctomycetes bacterium]|nr:hypothetical protein [Planctomycetota bacterium]
MREGILVWVLVASGAADVACAGFVYTAEGRNLQVYGEMPASPFPIQNQDIKEANGFGAFNETAQIWSPGHIRATQQSSLDATGFRVAGFVGEADPAPGGIATGLSRFDVTFTLTTATTLRFHGTSTAGNTDCWFLRDNTVLFSFGGGSLDRVEILGPGTYRFALTIYAGTQTHLPPDVNSSMDITVEQIPAPAGLAALGLGAVLMRRRR